MKKRVNGGKSKLEQIDFHGLGYLFFAELEWETFYGGREKRGEEQRGVKKNKEESDVMCGIQSRYGNLREGSIAPAGLGPGLFLLR
jgi:hypothetical protein